MRNNFCLRRGLSDEEKFTGGNTAKAGPTDSSSIVTA